MERSAVTGRYGDDKRGQRLLNLLLGLSGEGREGRESIELSQGEEEDSFTGDGDCS